MIHSNSAISHHTIPPVHSTPQRRATDTPPQATSSLVDIPANSTFGQWWNQLRQAFQSPDVQQWMQDRGMNPNSIKIDPTSGQIKFTVNAGPGQRIHTVGLDDPGWAAVSGPILNAARVIVADGTFTTFSPPLSASANSVPFKLMDHFYRASPLFSAQNERRSEEWLAEQQAQLADIRNRYQAAFDLRHLADFVREGTRDESDISHELNTRVVYVDRAGTYLPANAGDHNSVSVKQFIEDHGWRLPTNRNQLDNLVSALLTPSPKAPANGNYGGARAWPVPLDSESAQQLSADILQGKIGAIDLHPSTSVLEYLLDGAQVLASHTADPRRLIDRLIASPKGQALGQAIQAQFAARSLKGSPNDWLLAALTLDPSNPAEATPRTGPTVIAGYTLLSPQNAAKTATTVLRELTAELAKAGKGSSLEQAAIQATLMLASRAPAFLVKDIPQDLTVGTHSWVSFTTAVARIEALAPGATSTMTYAQVMLQASIAPVSEAEQRIEFVAQDAAIKAWAAANGMPYPTTDAALKRVREAFSTQVDELHKASQASTAAIPTAKGMAMEQLKKALPDLDPKLFEEKSISVQPANRYFPGPYSILDLYMDGRGIPKAPDAADNWGETGRSLVRHFSFGVVDLPDDGRPGAWVSSSAAVDINAVMQTLEQLPRLSEAFDTAFSTYSEAIKTATAAHIKHMVSKLPLADRQNFEFGKITIAKEVHYEWGGVTVSERNKTTEGCLHIKIERDGQLHNYQLDRLSGTITQRPDLGDFKTGQPYYKESRPFNEFKVVTPKGKYPAGLADEAKGATGIPDSFASARTAYLADAVLEDMDLPGVKRSAKGQTTFDTEVPTHEKVGEFALNLIPFRSAIVNFQKGNLAQGLGDLSWDIFGFLVGFGAGVKGAKALASGASALAKLGNTLKIVGRAAVGALNPVGGVDDLARGVVSGTARVAKAGYRGVKHLRTYRNVDLLKLAKRPDIAEGTYKTLNSSIESKALGKFDEASGKWYAVDPRTQQTYGKPLDDFVADAPGAATSDSLQAIGSADGVASASRQHGLAASGKFKDGQEAVEGTAVMFQGNWHRYDPIKKQPFASPLKDFTPSRIAVGGEVRPLDTTLLGYEAKYIASDELATKGLQGNVYVGGSQKEYVKIDGLLYESRLKDGQRIIRHPTGAGPDIPVRDLGASGWEPSSRSTRLLGGASDATSPWKLTDSTYVVPMDDIKGVENSTTPFRLNYLGVDHDVIFDSAAGAWKEANLATGVDSFNHQYFWRADKGKWARGPYSDFLKAKKTEAHHYAFVDVMPASALKIPSDAKPIPKNIHYFWAGQDIPSKLADNIVNNASQAPGYTSILHVDADTPALFQQIKQKMERKVQGIEVRNLQEDDVFKQLKNDEMYDYFRQGQGKNLAAASDVARYPITNKYGGFYLDTDDVIQAKVGAEVVNAGANDVLLNRMVSHSLSDNTLFYNTSNFGTQANNPIITAMITEMKKRFAANKDYFTANRPTATRYDNGDVRYTPEFNTYERKIFETVGPTLFNDNLKLKRPDMYDLGFDGLTREYKVVDSKLVPHGTIVNLENDVRRSYIGSGIVPPDTLRKQLETLKQHYLPLQHRFKVDIGAEHSWIDS